MADANAVARDQLRAFIERIERVEEEIATLNTDKSDIYKEARAVGFDVKVLRKVVAKRKLETHVREEQDAIFDMYWEALYGSPVHVHTHARENIEEFDAEAGEILDNNQASDGSPSVPSSPAESEAEEISASHSKMDRATEGSFETGSEAAEKGRKAIPAGPEGADLNHAGAGESPATDQPLVGGDHEVTGIASRERDMDPTSNIGEGAACALPANQKRRLRPNCLDRSNCKSGTVDHCWSCKKAMAEKSGVAA